MSKSERKKESYEQIPNPKQQNKDDNFPLMLAAAAGENRTVSFLVGEGAEVNLTNKKDGSTALSCAVIGEKFETALMLMEFGSNILTKITLEGGTKYSIFQIIQSSTQEEKEETKSGGISALTKLLSVAEKVESYSSQLLQDVREINKKSSSEKLLALSFENCMNLMKEDGYEPYIKCTFHSSFLTHEAVETQKLELMTCLR